MRATARIKVSPAWRAPTWVGSYAPTWVGSYMAGSHMGGFLHGADKKRPPELSDPCSVQAALGSCTDVRLGPARQRRTG